MEVLIFYTGKPLAVGSSKNLRAFNFEIQLRLAKITKIWCSRICIWVLFSYFLMT